MYVCDKESDVDTYQSSMLELRSQIYLYNE